MARFNNRCHQALLALALPITLLSAAPHAQALQADSIDPAANTNPEAVAADTASSDQESTEVLDGGLNGGTVAEIPIDWVKPIDIWLGEYIPFEPSDPDHFIHIDPYPYIPFPGFFDGPELTDLPLNSADDEDLSLLMSPEWVHPRWNCPICRGPIAFSTVQNGPLATPAPAPLPTAAALIGWHWTRRLRRRCSARLS